MKLRNKRFVFLIALFFAFSANTHAQKDIAKVLANWNAGTIPYIYAEHIPNQDSILYLDTREKEEYEVSHLKNAVWVGYKHFDGKRFLQQVPDTARPIIVYCSIGVRSEDIGEQLKALGYSKVLNLYGGIFDWKNNERTVYNAQGNPTDSVHAFSKYWGSLLHKGVKVY